MKKIFLILLFLSSSELFAQNGWQQIVTPTNTSYKFNTIFFISKDVGFLYYKRNSSVVFRDGRVYMTTNGGSSFNLTSVNEILTYAYFKNANTGWLLGYTIGYEIEGTYYGTYETTNGGASWTKIESFLNVGYTNCIKFANDSIGWKSKSNGYGIFKTTNGGANWDTVPGVISTSSINYITLNMVNVSEYHISAFNFGTGKVFFSTDSGINWNQSLVGSVIQSRPHFNFINGTCFLPTQTSAYKTTNFGQNWSYTAVVSQLIDVSTTNNQYLWICDKQGNIKFSSNAGISYSTQFSAGTPYDSASIFMFPADSLNHVVGYANLAGKLYKTTTGGQPTISIQNSAQIIPDNFGLTVYPNPFNPSSKIRIESKYFIPSLTINLYDLTGKLLRLTTYSNIQTGVNEFTVDYSGLPTGSYFLNITDGKLSETKKIVLLK